MIKIIGLLIALIFSASTCFSAIVAVDPDVDYTVRERATKYNANDAELDTLKATKANPTFTGEATMGTGGIQLDTSGTPPVAHSPGLLHWNVDDGTLNIDTGESDVTLQVNQEDVVPAKNDTGVTITNGQVVYISGAATDRPTIALSDADISVTTSRTIGVATTDINNGATGKVTTAGLVRGVSTTGFIAGDILWVSGTAGGYTNVEPAHPQHLMRVGYVITVGVTDGVIFVSTQRGEHLENLWEVDISTPADGEALVYDTASSTWKNGAPAIAAGAVGPTELASTTVIPGIYTATDITVDADGRITAASNGTAGGSALEVLDDGISLDTAVESIDFDGAGIEATVIGHAITVTVAAGAAPVDSVNGETGVVVLDASEINIIDTGALITATETDAALAENRTAINLNTSKVTNATHTGDVTGSGGLTLASVAISGKTLVTALGTDYILLGDTSDTGSLKRALISDITSGYMPTATYDPAGINEQLVGLTATQTLTNKTLTGSGFNMGAQSDLTYLSTNFLLDTDTTVNHVLSASKTIALDATVASNAANADNLTSGTVADALIASTITRDSEIVSANTNTFEFAYTDISAIETGKNLRVPTGASWTNAYVWCDGIEVNARFDVQYSATLGGVFASAGIIDLVGQVAATSTYDISAFTDPVAGGWIHVDILEAGTIATVCTVALDLVNN